MWGWGWLRGGNFRNLKYCWRGAKNLVGQNRSFWENFGGMVMQMMQGFLAGDAGDTHVF